MRYLLIVIAFLLVGRADVKAQKSCCSSSQSADLAFAQFGNESSFIDAHLPPEKIGYEPKIGKMVSLKTDDGKEARVFEVKSGASIGKIILLFHEWWGLTDQILKEAERLHQETGATVLALDLYDKRVTYNPEEAAKWMQELKAERAQAIIRAAIEYGGKFAKFQTLGWCMGGGWSMQAAIMAGDKGYGCVVYYGMPELDGAKLVQLQSPVLGIYGKKDQWITPELVGEFDKRMKVLQKPFTFHMYDADHAFANPSNPKFDKVATAAAHALVVDFLKKNFETPLHKGAVETK